MRGIHQPYELTMYSRKVNEYEVLPMGKELGLAWRYLMGDAEAGQAIINSNLRLVLKISRVYFSRGYNPLDTIHAGNMGLIKAIEAFDPGNGIKFSNHAVWWVHKHIRDYIHENSRMASAHAGSPSFPVPRRIRTIVERGISWINLLVMSKRRKKHLPPGRVVTLHPVSSAPAEGRSAVVKSALWKGPSLMNRSRIPDRA
jgi:RNA polymerase sigma factor (sigma-70 family)